MNKELWKASKVFAPGYPRQSADDRTIQSERKTRGELVDALDRASKNDMPGYYSVYSFPRGHSRDGNIPAVDCIFIDLDIPGDDYQPNENQPGYDTSFEAWRRSMSALLARARMIADSILEAEQEEHFRVTLSGHKGLHLYLDFPTVSPENGDFRQFKNGLADYGEGVMSWLDSTAGGVNIDPWVDVDGSDLARLARHPNTRHHGAKYDDEERWCVPVTVEELSDLTWEDYLDYTSSPRWPDGYERNPSDTAGQKVTQAIRTAASSGGHVGRSSTYDPSAVKEYKKNSNEKIELEDIGFITKNKPCIMAFRERDDAYSHGDASRAMELSIIARFAEANVPIDVMHEFFEVIPGYDEHYTQELIEDIIGRKYSEFDCETILSRSPQFCIGGFGDDPQPDKACGVYRRAEELQK